AGPRGVGAPPPLPRTPRASPLPVFVPPVRLEEPPPPAEPGPEASEPRFAIERFDVVGNTLLSPSEVDGALAPFVGADKRLADVEAARNALQKAYDAAGFLTVAVVLPQQNVSGGVGSLKVVDARLGGVHVGNDGVHWFSDDLVERDTPHLEPGAMLRQADLAADIQAANANPDRRVRPVLRAGQQEGSVDLDLVVDDRIPLHGGIEFTNERTPGSPT